MLLLVLILVLIAFGLLVVALMTGTVLWAWVSVAVSVAAALVLLVDYLQRRSAVKAGAASASVAPRPAPAPPRPLVADYEPATEVLPVVPPAVPVPGMPNDADQAEDSAKTIVMPAVQPSGSSSRPSGAEAAITSSSGISSQSVTESGSDRSSAEPVSGDAEAPADATQAVPSGDGGATTLVKASAASGEQPSAPSEGEATALVDARDLAEGQHDEQAAEPAVESAGSDEEDAAAPATTVAATTPPPVSAEQPTVFAEAPAREEAPAQEPEAATTMAPASIEEAPEESRDATLAAFVAGLDDEVVVVDEQPRYHVTDCRALVAYQVIPLPVREAVELGFTPCGWCSPDLTLSGRHPAATPR